MNKKFLYFIINPDSRELLKAELAMYSPSLKASYNRAGFITFVQESSNEGREFRYSPVFARHFGESIHKGSKLECIDFYNKNPKHPLVDTDEASVYPKAPFYELIQVTPEEYFLGLVTPKAFELENLPVLGNPKFTLPESAPSRAYLKIKEVDLLAGLNLKDSRAVIEFGASPGGAVYYLLENGLKVFGVDTGKMHENCLANPNFKWVNKSIQETLASDFKNTEIDWLISDMNMSPFAVFSELAKFFERTGLRPKKGIVLTLKLTKKEMVKELDHVEKKIFRLGFKIIFMKQVVSHHTEFAIVARAK